MMTFWTTAGVIAIAVVTVLLLGGVIGAALSWLLKRPIRPAELSTTGFRDGLYFGFVFLKFWVAAHVVGLVGGILYYLAISPLLGTISLSFLITKGIANGVFFLGWVWGPGIALVGTFIYGHRRLVTHRTAAAGTEEAGL